jgi:hypothetical protein
MFICNLCIEDIPIVLTFILLNINNRKCSNFNIMQTEI